MNVSIKNIRAASTDEWDYIWLKCDYSTYFHSREWAEIWNVYKKGKIRPAPKLVIFNDGKKALIPISIQRCFKSLMKIYISSPALTFGGWISADDLDKKHGTLLVKVLVKKYDNLIWRMNPYDKLIFQLGIQESKNDKTHVLNLERGFYNLYKQWSKGHRSAVNKAQNEGIIITIARKLEEWEIYYSIYEATLRRWGDRVSSRYSWELFYEIFQRDSSHIKLWLAIYEDDIVAGGIFLYSKKHVVAWHGAGLKKYFILRPVNLLMCEVIKNACEQGYSWFDFNPSGGHKGVRDFKKNFGTESLSCPVVTNYNRKISYINKIRGIIQKTD